MERYNHAILRDSDDFLAKLTSLTFPRSAKIVKIDAKDFYMSGHHADLVRYSTSLVADADGRFVLSELMTVLLSSQYVGIAGDKAHRHWLVDVGAGMGMVAAGDIADGAFTAMVEVPAVQNPRFIRAFGVLMCTRFKDDIFAIVVSPAPSFVNTLRGLSRFFRLTVDGLFYLERIAREEEWVPFLDVCVLPVETETGDYAFHFKPYTKPTSLWLPLSHTSCHAPNVHTAWVGAYKHRLQRHPAATSSTLSRP